jgi:hypothetical protein
MQRSDLIAEGVVDIATRAQSEPNEIWRPLSRVTQHGVVDRVHSLA